MFSSCRSIRLLHLLVTLEDIIAYLFDGSLNMTISFVLLLLLVVVVVMVVLLLCCCCYCYQYYYYYYY